MLPRLAVQHGHWTGAPMGGSRSRTLTPQELETVFARRGREIHIDADLRHAGQHVTTKYQRPSHSRPRRDVSLLQQRLERLSRPICRQLHPFAAAARTDHDAAAPQKRSADAAADGAVELKDAVRQRDDGFAAPVVFEGGRRRRVHYDAVAMDTD